MKPLLSALLFACALSLATPVPAAAHELLPQELLDYIEEHPGASQAEIEAFLNAKPDVYGGDAAYKVRLLQSAQTPDQGFWHNGWDFINLGMIHIFEGTDHILFVLSLLLVFTSVAVTLKHVSFFTVSHSVSLLLAGTGVLILTSRVVEPIIAFSIAYVAITTVFFGHLPFFRSSHNKSATIFVFGLFHGLGFAGVLSELAVPRNRFVSSLLFFNVGIEVGQIIIVAAALPLILWLRRYSWYPRAIQVLAVLISAVALYWMAERIIAA